MPKFKNLFPLKQEVIDYLCQYEKRYELPIEHSLTFESVIWNHVAKEDFDAIIWCTGFGCATSFLKLDF